MLKKCIKCGRELEETEFATTRDRKKNLRYLNSCKDCMREYKHQHYLKNQDKAKARTKKYHKEHREEDLAYYKNYYRANKEEIIEKQKEYLKTDKGKEVKKKCNYNYYHNIEHKLKNSARKKLLRAIQSGKIIRPTVCENCGKTDVMCEGHHTDYNKPYDVMWLCKQCHENMHHLNGGHQSEE